MRLGILILLSVTWALATEPCRADFDQGVQAYNQEQYGAAITAWQNCLDQGVRSAELHYNLGNAYYRQGELGRAIGQYLSAQRLQPTDGDIAVNLRYAEQSAVDQVEMVSEENPVLKGIWRAHHWLDASTQAQLLVALVWLWAVLWALLWITPARKLRLFYNVAVLVVVICGALLGLSLGAKVYEQKAFNSAVIVSRDADVMSGPGAKFQVLHELHEGTVVEVRELSGDWVSVRLGDQIAGFVARKNLEVIP